MAFTLNAGPVSNVTTLSQATVAVTLTSVAAGDLVVCFCSTESPTITGVAVDTGEFVSLLTESSTSSNTRRVRIAWFVAASAGSKVITSTCAFVGGHNKGITALSYTPGAGKVPFFDAQNGVTGTSAGLQSTTLTTLHANPLVVAVCLTESLAAEPTPGTNYTGIAVQNGSNYWINGEYDLDGGAAGAVVVDFTVTAVSWAIRAASFYDAAPAWTVTSAESGAVSTAGQLVSATITGVLAGDVLAIGVYHNLGTLGTITITSEANATKGTPRTSGNNHSICPAYLAPVVNSGTKVVEADVGAAGTGQRRQLVVMCFRAVSGKTAAFDDMTSFLQASGITNPSLNVNTSQAGNALFGFVVNESATTDPIEGAGYTPRALADHSNTRSAAEYQPDAGAAGTKAVNWVTPANASLLAAISFKAVEIQYIGTAAGTSTATGVGVLIAGGAGSAAGTSAASAFAAGTSPAAGSAAGTSAAAAVGVAQVTSAAAGEAAGAVNVVGIGVGFGTIASVGAASGVSTANAVNASLDINAYGVLTARFPLMDAEIRGNTDGTLTAVMPSMRARLDARIVPIGTLTATFPLLRMSAAGGMDGIVARFPMMRAAIFADASVSGVLTASLFRPSAQLTGSAPYVGELAARFLPMRSTLVAYQVPTATLTARMPRMQARLGSVVGALGVITARLPLMRAALSTHSSVSGVLVARLPRLFVRMVGGVSSGTGVPAAEPVLTLVLGTTNMALTEYAQYPFNSFMEMNGVYYAAGEDGIFQIDAAAKDEGEDIDARFSTAQLDFGSEFLKRMTDAYAGMRANGQLLVRVTVDEEGEIQSYDYLLDPLDINTLRQRRVPVGKGLRGKYWQFEFTNVAGSDFEIDSLNLAAVVVARRI